METMSNRAAAIKSHFILRATTEGFEALWLRPDGTVFSRYTNTDRAKLVSTVQCQWGHFNYEDEARAFAEVMAQ